MATFRQAGQCAAKDGIPAERAVLTVFSAEMPAAELGRGLDDFLDGFGVARANPARASLFERCVKSVSARGGAVDPRAVCAAAGRKKYGQAEMTRRSVAVRKRAARRRGNPADASDSAYQEFHGHEPDVVVEVRKRQHRHEFLAGAGILRALEVKGIDHQIHVIRGFKGALLAFNEAMNQLFIEGGDQKVNLDDFGITDSHELETLGKVLTIDYQTNKTHLGKEGGDAVYHHKFRTTNEDGREVVVEIKRYPDLIYRVLDEQLEFSGGSYTIRREGIDF